MLGAEKPPENRHIYRFSHCELSEVTGDLRVRGELVSLPPRDRAVLFLLVRRAGEFVSSEEAAEAIWGDYPARGKTVGNAVWNVRQAIGDEDHSIIKNERNRGYILVAPVEKTLACATPELQLAAGMPVPGRLDCTLEEKIGTGGYGDVWLCRTPEGRNVFKFSKVSAQEAAIKREVTISRLIQASLNDEQCQSFVPIIEWDFEVWPSYVETPYAGLNLEAWPEKLGGLKAVPLAQRIEIVATIADAVGLAHSVGALHKDLKPENVLIEESQGKLRIRLTDFGAGHLLNREKLEALAITVRGWTQSRAADATSGTLLWMAPELFEGATLTLQSDVYSLGVLLYQMVVGDLGRVLAPDWHPDIVDELLREDIDIATRRDPAQRLGDAKELARRLRSLDERRSEREQLRNRLRRTEEAEEALKKARARRPFVWATAAALLVGLCTSSYFYYEQVQRTREARALSDFVTEDFLDAALPANGGTATITLKDAMVKAVPLAKKRFVKEPDLEAKILSVFGNTMSDLGAYRETSEIMARLAELDTRLHGAKSDDVIIDRLIIAYDHLEEGDVDQAEKEIAKLRPQVKPNGKAYPVWLQIESSFAFERSDMDRAVELSRKTIEYQQSRMGATSNGQTQLDLANLTLLQALVYAGRSAEAVEAGAQLIPDLNKRYGATDSYTLWGRQSVAAAHRDLRQFEQADKQFSEICPLIDRQNGSSNKDSLNCLQEQAQLFASMRRWADAAANYKKVFDGYSAITDDCAKSAPCIYAAADLGQAMLHIANEPDAIHFTSLAVSKAKMRGTADSIALPYSLYAYASVAIGTNNIAEAQSALDQLSAATKEVKGSSDLWTGRCLLAQARIAFITRHVSDANLFLSQAVGILQQFPTLAIIDLNEADALGSHLPHAEPRTARKAGSGVVD